LGRERIVIVPHMERTPAASVEPLVWVITLNWNGREWLGDCLSSVLAMDYPNFRVLVVDNGSKDESVTLIKSKFPSVAVLELGVNLGYAGGFSRGLEYAAERDAEYFLIMNNDTVIDRAALSALVQTSLAHDRAGFVTGKVFFYDQPDVLQTVGKKLDPIRWNGDHLGAGERDVGQYDQVSERPFLDDVFTLASARMYKEVGGYDPQLFLNCEEFDWQARASRSGWRFYYTPDAKIWHRVSMSMGGRGSPVGKYFDVRSAMVVMATRAGLRRFLRYYLWTGYGTTRSLAAGVVRSDSAAVRPRLAAFLGFIGGTLWLAHRRPPKRVPCVIRKLAR
jgi:GT2 family glycosyltransferase